MRLGIYWHWRVPFWAVDDETWVTVDNLDGINIHARRTIHRGIVACGEVPIV